MRLIFDVRRASTSDTTTITDHSVRRHPCKPCPGRLNSPRSNAWGYVAATGSAEFSTSTDLLLDLGGRNFRHAHGSADVLQRGTYLVESERFGLPLPHLAGGAPHVDGDDAENPGCRFGQRQHADLARVGVPAVPGLGRLG